MRVSAQHKFAPTAALIGTVVWANIYKAIVCRLFGMSDKQNRPRVARARAPSVGQLRIGTLHDDHY
ncbi:hypothetical protein NRB_28490 [Novosphingobium sp. 11B]